MLRQGSGTCDWGKPKVMEAGMTGARLSLLHGSTPSAPQPAFSRGGCFRSKRLRHFVLACGSCGDVWFHSRSPSHASRPHQRQGWQAPHYPPWLTQPCTNPIKPPNEVEARRWSLMVSVCGWVQVLSLGK
jgi:hypothetical protein